MVITDATARLLEHLNGHPEREMSVAPSPFRSRVIFGRRMIEARAATAPLASTLGTGGPPL